MKSKTKPKSRPGRRGEYEAFATMLGQIASVPHDAVKAKLEAEMNSKKSKGHPPRSATSY
jgi:hypothetical protein